MNKELIGEKVYFSVDAEHCRELTNDTYLEGCRVLCGVVNDVDLERETIKIDDKIYVLPFDTTGVFFDNEVLCILTLNYAGSDFLKIDMDGNISIDAKALYQPFFATE